MTRILAALAAVLPIACALGGKPPAGPVTGVGTGDKTVTAKTSAASAADSARAASLASALGDFERTVLRQDTAALLRLLDSDWKKKELAGFYQGNTPHFLNEFFCGKAVVGDQQFCQAFAGISGLQGTDTLRSARMAEVTYRVKSPAGEIRSRLHVTLEKDGTVRGFIGSNGYTQVE